MAHRSLSLYFVNAHESSNLISFLVFEAKFNHFFDVYHLLILGSVLRVACLEVRQLPYIKLTLVFFDNDVKFFPRHRLFSEVGRS